METEKHANSNYKVKFMCSYGGKIQPRPHHHELTYVGGDTKILTVDRNINLSDLIAKLNSLRDTNSPFCLKYQLPGEDLDSLISVFNDDDLEHMMVEYDRIHRIPNKPARLRLFMFLPTGMSQSVTPTSPFNPDFLFGFDKEYTISSSPNPEIPQHLDTNLQGNVGSNPRDEEEIQKQTQIQEIVAQGFAGSPVAYSCDSNVMSGSYTAYPAPLFYRMPVATGGYYLLGQYGGMPRVVASTINNREQPVYTFLPVIPSAQEQKIPVGGHVSIKHSEGMAAYDGAGAEAEAEAGAGAAGDNGCLVKS